MSQTEEIRRVFGETGSKRATAARLGISYRQVDNVIGGVPAAPIVGGDGASLDEVVRDHQAKIDVKRFRNRESELVKQIASERSFRDFLAELMREVAPALPPPPPYRPFKEKNDASDETLLLVWSDWHAYETVKSERVLGLNEYNAPTMARRVKRIVDSTISIKQRMERGNGWQFPKCVVGCNGDMISGSIHEVERHSDAPNVLMAAYGTGMILASALRDLAAQFEHIDFYGTSGNHGRHGDARRMQQKDPTRSWDTAIYLFAKTALRDVKNITFHIPDSYAVIYTIQGYNFLQTHGHEIKSWNSIPYYGIDRYGRNINSLLTSHDMPINYFIISHFHSQGGVPSPGGETFINGSLIGGNEHSVNALGKCDRPKQWMFCVHPKQGVASRWPILADGGDGDSYEPFPWEVD